MNQEKIIIGTRGSKLALWQANYTKDLLEANGVEVEIKIIVTKGDITHHLSFDKLEGKGFFTKEIEDALLNKEVNLAVHSSKDMPTEYPEGLTLAAFSYRAGVQDVLIIRKGCVDQTKDLLLKENAIVGSSSSRRKAQILSYRPDLELKDIRGNVHTRIAKLENGDFDAILLAAAGIERLEVSLEDYEVLYLDPVKYVPAPAQGILAYQIRESDRNLPVISKALKILNHEAGSTIAHIERSILQAFKGGCQVPIGIYSKKSEGENDLYDLWISKATSWNAMPKRYFEKVDLKTFDAQAIVDRVDAPTSKSVFISREIEVDDFLFRMLSAHNYTLSGKNLINFEPIEFKNSDLEGFEWLFFSSKVAVKFFFDKIKQVPNGIKIAAINEGTAMAIKEFGFMPDFIGFGSDMEQIAEQFYQLSPQKVLFPSAKNGRQTIQKILSQKGSKDFENLFIYDNQPLTNTDKLNQDVLVFTSPLNVQAYFSYNTLDENQKVLSIGSTTSEALDKIGIHHQTSYSPLPWSIADSVFAI